jgi:hypothetical protein
VLSPNPGRSARASVILSLTGSVVNRSGGPSPATTTIPVGRVRSPRVIDLHTHILPGLDDGPRTLDESVSMARAAVADGIRIVAATPHVRADYPTSASEMERGVAELREALADEGIMLHLRTGGEIALDTSRSFRPKSSRGLVWRRASCEIPRGFRTC